MNCGARSGLLHNFGRLKAIALLLDLHGLGAPALARVDHRLPIDNRRGGVVGHPLERERPLPQELAVGHGDADDALFRRRHDLLDAVDRQQSGRAVVRALAAPPPLLVAGSQIESDDRAVALPADMHDGHPIDDDRRHGREELGHDLGERVLAPQRVCPRCPSRRRRRPTPSVTTLPVRHGGRARGPGCRAAGPLTACAAYLSFQTSFPSAAFRHERTSSSPWREKT